MRTVRKITDDNCRIVSLNESFDAIKRDYIEPEPVGTIILMVFRITGYDKDCDGSAMVRAEHIDKDGDITGWDIDSIGLHPDTGLVVTKDELTKLFN